MNKINFDFFKIHFKHSVATNLLKLLLIVDILFILGHAFIALILDYKYRYLLVDTDGGYPEIFQYLKFLILVILTFTLTTVKKYVHFFPWFFLFTFLAFDDSFQLHEKSGKYLADNFGLNGFMGLRPVDYGELLYASIIGLIFFSTLFFSYMKGPLKYRKSCLDILGLFFVFLFFGIGVDMFHQIIVDVNIVSAIVALIEDGGEMIALSLLVWYFYYLSFSTDSQKKYIHQFFLSKPLRLNRY